MGKELLFIIVVNLCQGFLLDSSNTSSAVKQSYLTVNEYYGDKIQLYNEIMANRNQQERSLKVLADQLQQRLLAMEQKMTHQQSANLSDQRYKELEMKYADVKGTLHELEQKYQELAQNCTKPDLTLGTLRDQNQSCSALSEKVKTFDARINLLSEHEKSRNQDFLGLYKLTTTTENKLKQVEVDQNKCVSTLQETRYNFTNTLDKFANATRSKMESLSQIQNSSLENLQHSIEENNRKVVLVGCHHGLPAVYNSGSALKFPTIITEVGIPDLTTFSSTGKFTSPVYGIYHISAVLTTNGDNVPIHIMKNSVSMHYQYINGKSHSDGTHGDWTPGVAIIALELNVNDTVWIKTNSKTALYYSCLTIFKL